MTKPFETVTPVIIALDVRRYTDAVTIMDLAMQEYDPSDVMFKLPDGAVRHWDDMTKNAKDEGFGVIEDTRFEDEPEKVADKICMGYNDEPLAVYPDAITVHPPALNSSAEQLGNLKEAIDVVSAPSHPSGGIAILGYARADKFHPTDGDLIGEHAHGVYTRMGHMHFAGMEVVYAGLQQFFEEKSTGLNNSNEKIITSKLSQESPDGLLIAATNAFRLGADAVQLGYSVTKAEGSNRLLAVKTVLTARQRA